MLKLRYYEPHHSYIMFTMYCNSYYRNQSQVCRCSSLVPVHSGVRTWPLGQSLIPFLCMSFHGQRHTTFSINESQIFQQYFSLSPLLLSPICLEIIPRYPLVCLVPYPYPASARRAGRWPTRIPTSKLRICLGKIMPSSACK